MRALTCLLYVFCSILCQTRAYFPGLNPQDTDSKCRSVSHYDNVLTDDRVSPAPEPGQGPTPFTITLNVSEYLPKAPISVSVTSKTPFQGLLIQAVKYDLHPVGVFTLVPSDGSTVYCDGGSNNTWVTWFDQPTNHTEAVWTPSSHVTGIINFRGTVFTDENTYWPNVTSSKIIKGFEPIDLSECGKVKGCFRYPPEGQSDCGSHDCDYIATYRVEGTDAIFELSGSSDWIALGFSSDDKMGGDDVLMCVHTGSGVSVRQYEITIPYMAPTLRSSSHLHDVEVNHNVHDRITCRFRRLLKDKSDFMLLDLYNDWYHLYAWGPASSDGDLVTHTRPQPPTSERKLTLHQIEINVVGGAPLNLTTPPCVAMAILAMLVAFSLSRMSSMYVTQRHLANDIS